MDFEETKQQTSKLANEKIKWIEESVENEEAALSDQPVTESESLVLLYKLYRRLPFRAPASLHWAEGYYISAKEFGYSTWDKNKWDQPISRTHAAELIASIHDENLRGAAATQFLIDHFLQDSSHESYGLEDGLTQVEASDLVKMVKEKVFGIIQEIINSDQEKQATITVLGDSITLGRGTSSSDSSSENSYPYIIKFPLRNQN